MRWEGGWKEVGSHARREGGNAKTKEVEQGDEREKEELGRKGIEGWNLGLKEEKGIGGGSVLRQPCILNYRNEDKILLSNRQSSHPSNAPVVICRR